MSRVQRELESILEDIHQALLKADCILEQSRESMKYPRSLDTTLLDIISELYLMKTRIILQIGSMTSTKKY